MSEKWSEKELKAAVEAYIEMRSNELNQLPYTKKTYYKTLSEKFGRTEKSYEYRMQNISYVYSLMGREWVSGLRPARNVGANVIAIIKQLISDVENQLFYSQPEFEAQVKTELSKEKISEPDGILKPSKIVFAVTQFTRNPQVKAWVLKNAKGFCECCNQPSPFLDDEGIPYLEVHHLRRLADGGSDRTSNAIAICPNCHRLLHYGANRGVILLKLYNSITRLKQE